MSDRIEQNGHKGYADEENFSTVKEGGVLVRRRFEAPENQVGYEEISLIDASDPMSLYNLVSNTIREKMKLIPPRMLTMSEDALRKAANITDVEEHTRLAFWDEFGMAQDQKAKMRMENVYRVTNRMYFYREIVGKTTKLAYMLTPPSQYRYKMREMLEMSHRRMREVLNLSILDKRGNPNVPLIREIVKIAMLVENRVMGAVKQQVSIESKSMNVNINSERKGYFDVESELKAIDAQIAQLRDNKELINGREAESGDASLIGFEAGIIAQEEDGIKSSSETEGT